MALIYGTTNPTLELTVWGCCCLFLNLVDWFLYVAEPFLLT